MTDSHPDIPPAAPTRREMLRMSAAAAAGALIPAAFPAIAVGPATTPDKPGDTLNLAIIGAGAHGRSLINCAVKMPGVRFKAVCDIWPYNLQYSARLLKKYDHLVNTYADYQDLLDKEKDLDAVINGSVVEVGQSINGAKVVAVNQFGVELELDGVRFVVRM